MKLGLHLGVQSLLDDAAAPADQGHEVEVKGVRVGLPDIAAAVEQAVELPGQLRHQGADLRLPPLGGLKDGLPDVCGFVVFQPSYGVFLAVGCLEDQAVAEPGAL